MKFETITPSKALAKYVRHYWVLESDPMIPCVHRIIPNGLTELMFYLSERPSALDPKKNLPDQVLVNGQLSTYFDLEISAPLSLFCVYFWPHGLSRFLSMPMKEVFDQSIPLRYLFKEDITALEEEMHQAKTLLDKTVLVERFLLQMLQTKAQPSRAVRMDHCMRLIYQSRGAVTIEQLAAETCWSRRQFERQFLTAVGTSPRQFLKIVRFQRAIQHKVQTPTATLTETALAAGYYDQAHMVEDFRLYSGWSPKAFFAQGKPHADFFQ